MTTTRTFSLPQLPPMQCDDGCGECCGIVPCSADEFVRISRVVKAQSIRPVRQGATCPLFIGGRCSVYHARPLLCRLYGHAPGMECPRGYDTPAKPETVAAYRAELHRSGGVERARWVHELAYGVDEIAGLLETELAADTKGRGARG